MNQLPDSSSSLLPQIPLQTSSMAIISLIFGVLAWLGIFGLGGIIAVIFGHLAKNEIRRSQGRLGGSGLATAGLVLGYTNIALALLGLCLFILFWVGVISAPFLCLPFFNDMNTVFFTQP